MDYDTPPLEETMNAIFRSKISIVASYIEEETLQNNIVLSYESKAEGYSDISETVEIQATSKNYNIIEISEDGVTFTPVSPSKEIRVTKEYMEESNPTFYVRDEVGNVEKIDILLKHLDQSGPEIIATPQEEWGITNTIAIELKDEKSGLSGYQITTTEEEPTEWKSVSGNTTTVEEVVNENKTYYIWSKDVLGNMNHQEVTVSKIDTNAPISRFTTSVTGGSVSIDASASTEKETKIVKYEYRLDDGSYYPSETSSYTFTGVSHGTHTVSVRVTDEAGNQHETSQSVEVIILFTITYNANGGSGAPNSQTKTYGVNLTLSSTSPTRTGYTFLGWSTSSTATSATYSAGGTFTSNANTTLYAVWRANTYTLTVNPNGGTWNGSSSSQSYQMTTNSTRSIPIPSAKYGYRFSSWSLSGTNATMSSVTSASTFKMGTSNATLTANYVLGGEQFRAVSPNLTSQQPGNFFQYATITTNASAFSFSNSRAYCNIAGTYSISLTATATYNTSQWHGTVYLNGNQLFNAGHVDGTITRSVTLAVGDYIYCNSAASGDANGYLTLTISK